MYQTGYLPIKNFSTHLAIKGGFCRWWFIEKDKIKSWPHIDPTTQFLYEEPQLIDGASWYGPVKVPDRKLGFNEQLQRHNPGKIYKQSISGFYPGDSPAARINIANMLYYEYVVVAKPRTFQNSSLLYLVFGNIDQGLRFSYDYNGGTGMGDTAGAKITFSLSHQDKAQVLLFFTPDVVKIISEDGNDIINETGEYWITG